ncbi:MAG: fumarylacetoacetate hydrolase family protein [Chitinophagaceae bacterium]|nr:fumarylacetoacetate hydrolase family protein [Chitinophagaceae bacterium]
MRIYKTRAGIVLQSNNQFFLDKKNSWDELVNDDAAYQKAQALVKTLPPVEVSVLQDILPPIGSQQEVWACGVTYYRSMVGRQEESQAAGGADFYGKVYEAERPECFFKASAFRVKGPHEEVRIRKDSTWDVPEPELTLVVTSSGKIIGYTIGNDMSSRSIEGENPLYLPQAKTYDGSAAVGPCILLTEDPLPTDTTISMSISRNGEEVFNGQIGIEKMKRTPAELVSYIYRETSFPHGCLVMTGTGIVPDHPFTLQSGDVVAISIEGVGELVNTVE